MSFWMSPGGAAAISGGTSLVGGLLNRDSGRDERVWATWMDNRNYDRQRYMAQHSTGWQLDDIIDTARENGIHALAALGTQSAAQYTPGNIPTDTFGGGNTKKALGDAMSSAVNTFFQAKEMKMREKRNDAEIDLLEAQAKSYEDELRGTIVASGFGGEGAKISGAGNSAAPAVHDVQRMRKPSDLDSYFHKSGPYAGHWVIPMGDGTYAFDARKLGPAELFEALSGQITSEAVGIGNTLRGKRVKRPGGYKGPKRKGYPGEEVKIGGDVWVWSRALGKWRKRKSGGKI